MNTNKEIEEGNKIIAEFIAMRVDSIHGETWIVGHEGNEIWHNEYIENWKFHTSWDWLMPVVEKIENDCSEPYSIEIDKYSCGVRYIHAFNGKKVQFLEVEGTKIQTVWATVVQFIKWYNNNQKQPQ